MKPAEFSYLRPRLRRRSARPAGRESRCEDPRGRPVPADADEPAAGPAVGGDRHRRALAELGRIFDDTDDLVLGALDHPPHRRDGSRRSVARAPLTGRRGALHRAHRHPQPRHHRRFGRPRRPGRRDAPGHTGSRTPPSTSTRRRSGRRQVAAEEMFVSFYTNALEPDEMITWISVPAIRPDQGWGFVEYAHQHGDYGLAGAGCTLTLRPGRHGGRGAGRGAQPPPTGHCCSSATEAVGAEPSRAACGRTSPTDWARRTEPAADDADYAPPVVCGRAHRGADRRRAAGRHDRGGGHDSADTPRAVAVSVTVNGREFRRSVPPRLTLADFLRDELGLTGTHLGCEHGVCGACSVFIDGRSVRGPA